MGEHGTKGYIKIYVILLVLFVVSVLGPELGIKAVTLITAFGIAIVKALMVCAYFMHLNTEKRYIWYMLITCLALLFMFFAALTPDIMAKEGRNWKSKIEFVNFNTHHGDDHHGDDHHGEDHKDGDGHDHDDHDHGDDDHGDKDHATSKDELGSSAAPAAS